MTLYHFSEEPGIAVFEPRAPSSRPEVEPMVWTVDEERAWTYLFPRDCPRVLLWKNDRTKDEDWVRWAGPNITGRVACIEHGWLETVRSTTVYRYSFAAETFGPLSDEDPWMMVSRQTVRPERVEAIGDLIAAMAEADVELRVMPDLRPLRGAWESTVHFSGIRLRNAKGWAL